MVTDFEQAKAVYDRIGELEEKRDNLLGGSGFGSPLPDATFTKMLAELDATLKAYKSKYFLASRPRLLRSLLFESIPQVLLLRTQERCSGSRP